LKQPMLLAPKVRLLRAVSMLSALGAVSEEEVVGAVVEAVDGQPVEEAMVEMIIVQVQKSTKVVEEAGEAIGLIVVVTFAEDLEEAQWNHTIMVVVAMATAIALQDPIAVSRS